MKHLSTSTTKIILNSVQWEIQQEQDSDTTLDQDIVVRALCHMPIELVSVRGREHPHVERTPTGVVSWTERVEGEKVNEEILGRPKGTVELWNCANIKLRIRNRDEEMSKQNRKECDQIFRTEARIQSVFWERMICLWNSELRRLPFA